MSTTQEPDEISGTYNADQITVLEANIEQYKTDYAVSIREIETIKAEMESVKTKVSRAESLLVSLGQEQERWDAASKGVERHDPLCISIAKNTKFRR